MTYTLGYPTQYRGAVSGTPYHFQPGARAVVDARDVEALLGIEVNGVRAFERKV